ncbi:sensor histidine kinase [Breoghania sp. JC706]|uniref:sensor histidine kinase n=1 Tax=Breoghania sp. JC706 TaxID=3117732 RepID=UPI00300B8A2B
MNTGSLKNRLFVFIVVPLFAAACVASVARYSQFTKLSRDLYDNTLYTIALTISRDVTTNEGDLLTRAVLNALVETLGDQIFYRITGPGGAYVTGMSDAPNVPNAGAKPPGEPVYFDAVYHGQPVRGLFMTEVVTDRPMSGTVTVEVWQTIRQRQELSLSLLGQTAVYFGGLLAVAGLLVWFGIRNGLKPLKDLEAALVSRTANDLRPIEQVVPREIGALVAAMNSLFERLRRAFEIRDAFISDAAHQVRTPIAGIQAQAEAALTARDETALRARVEEVAVAARRAGRLTNQLLSMERVRGRDLKGLAVRFDLEATVQEVTRHFAERVLPKGIEINYQLRGEPRSFAGDPVLLGEMLLNLLENAERYGIAVQPVIDVILTFAAEHVELDVRDNGPGIPPASRERVFDRFYRVAPEGAIGCGLGLSIVRDIAQLHHGDAQVMATEAGCHVRVVLVGSS